MNRFGIFNVGYLQMRRDAVAAAALSRWRSQCIEWCFDRLEDGKFGDQKYLDDWPECFPGVRELQHPGAGVAPWNWSRYRWKETTQGMMVDDVPLVFFHFHGLRIFFDRLYDPGRFGIGVPPPRTRKWLYDGYLRSLLETRDSIREVIGAQPLGAGLSRYSWPKYIGRLAMRLLHAVPPVFVARR